MPTDITDVTGIGPTTADKLASIGITDVPTLCRAYFLHPGHTVADVLHSTQRVHQQFFRDPATALGTEGIPDVPVPDAGLIAAMAFAREFGTVATHPPRAAYDEPDERETLQVVPSDIDWTENFLVAPGKAFGLVLNPSPPDEDETDAFNPLAVDTQPDAVAVDPDANRVTYSADGHEVTVDSRLLDRIIEFVETDYTTTDALDAVRMPSEDVGPVYFHVGTAYPLAIAPILPAEDEAVEDAESTNQSAAA